MFRGSLLCVWSCAGGKDAMGVLLACREGCRALPGYRLGGGPNGEWLGPVAAALVSDSSSTEIWRKVPPNSPVGLGSQAVCVLFISVTSEIPRGPSTWSETETARVQLEVRFRSSQGPRQLLDAVLEAGGGLFLGHLTQMRDTPRRNASLGPVLGGSAFCSRDACLLRHSRPFLGSSAALLAMRD